MIWREKEELHFWGEPMGGGSANNATLGNSLLIAAYHNSFERTKMLIELGTVDYVDERSGLTALHIAVGRNNLEIAKLLVEKGAPFVPDNDGRMPSLLAATCGASDEMNEFIAQAEAKALKLE